MSEFHSWTPAVQGMTIGMVGAMIAFPISIGYLAGAGWGWLMFGIIMLLFAKTAQEEYHKEQKGKRES